MSAQAAVSVRDALDGARTAIAAGGSPSARLDAELLLAAAMGVTRSQLIREPQALLAAEAVRPFQLSVRRRSMTREPVAYIIGERGFRRLTLAVDARVLIPRPETELLVEVVGGLTGVQSVLDCCTGSGAVALALKDEHSALDVAGSDISPSALEVASANGRRLNLDVRWCAADLLDGIDAAYDVIVANPPYVCSAEIETLPPDVARHEPRTALDGGGDGLDVIRRLVAQVALRGTPILAFEHGAGQAEAAAGICRRAGFATVEHHRDLAGINRVVLARR